MRVLKRDNTYEDVSLDKVQKRISVQCEGLDVSGIEIAQKVCSRIHDGVKTSTLDDEAARLCAQLITKHPDYGIVAARIAISNHHKKTSPSFSETMSLLYAATDAQGQPNPLISEELWNIVQMHKDKLNSVIDYDRDYGYDYFGFKTLERSYLLKVDGRMVERPQHMIMRVALGIHGWDLKEAIETYELMSRRYFTHATPTLFNAGTPRCQLASCFLMGIDDSISGMYKGLGDCAQISKYAGGIGIHIQDIRPTGSYIRGTNGSSTGIVPMLRVFNAAGRHVNQCFRGDTIVYGKAGAKQMQDVIVGDKLVTIDGSMKPVLEIARSNINKEILKIRTKYSLEPVYVTKEHQIYAITGQSMTNNYSEIFGRLEKKLCAPQYKSAGQLTEADYVGYSIPAEIIDYNESADFFRFYGILLGDAGHVAKRKNCNSNCVEFEISLDGGRGGGHAKNDTFGFACEFLTQRGVPFTTDKTGDSVYQIRWVQNTQLLNITYDDLYNQNENEKLKQKRLLPKYLNLPFEKTYALLKGIFETDGHACGHDNCDEISFHNTSKELIYAVRYLLLRIGVLSSGYIKNVHAAADAYVLRIPKHAILKAVFGDAFKPTNHFNFFRYYNMLWSRIQSIEHEVFEGYVYDFNMEDNHNYLTDMGIVHNSGKRNGSIAVYIEPWHADIEHFIELRKNSGNNEERCHDLFTALWIPDLFMKRVEANEEWSLMCPDECPGLTTAYGDDFEKLYVAYEEAGKYKKKLKAQAIFYAIMRSQIETGTPYMLYKDAVNKKTNQKNIGTIKSSNLCSEICEYSDDTETAVCNLASIGLPTFVKAAAADTGTATPAFDFAELHRVTQVITRNLNKVIDRTFYPTPETKKSNLRHRPIGIGVQGLANTYVLMRLPFESPEACELNRKIFATIYHAALTASVIIAKRRHEYREELAAADAGKGDPIFDTRREFLLKYLNMIPEEESITGDYSGAYSTFAGSPASQGLLQFDLWGAAPDTVDGLLDWDSLKAEIVKYGLRNSLLLAPMPTATTSQILGFNESFEAFTSNIYQRQTLAGEFTIINKHLIADLLKIGLWNPQIKDKILSGGGSIQNIKEIPEDIRALYKTVWEIRQKIVIDQSADRGIYVCQSQSLNIHVEDADFAKMNNIHFYGWKKGLKTGMYYLRTRPKAKISAFTLAPPAAPALYSSSNVFPQLGGGGDGSSSVAAEEPIFACSRDNPSCEMCSG